MGATDPRKADKGTIRADFAQSIDANAVHGSDSAETAAVEIAYFFPTSGHLHALALAPRMVNLLGLTPSELQAFCAALGEKPYRAKQLLRWIHHAGADSFDAMTDVSKALRARLAEAATIAAPAVRRDTLAADGTRKWLLDVGTGNAIETVFIPEPARGTLCISSQAGCALECSFCSTGRQGFNRNLTRRRNHRPALACESRALARRGSRNARSRTWS